MLSPIGELEIGKSILGSSKDYNLSLTKVNYQLVELIKASKCVQLSL